MQCMVEGMFACVCLMYAQKHSSIKYMNGFHRSIYEQSCYWGAKLCSDDINIDSISYIHTVAGTLKSLRAWLPGPSSSYAYVYE